MTVRKTKDIRKALTDKGFKESNSRHKRFILYVNNKKTTVRTVISHGKKEYSNTLLSAMSKQLRLSNEELLDLIDCPLTYESYIALLYDRNEIKE
ncbi:type II toxin-antitoxin system HicA family toxin [Bacillus piscicola]|uniref:type II toxin-antitoxin system HicA family toxin n=1 Tax=Bacillus piscicola TaxID=1632684 RepID=UPI001F0A000A|nr:type II toxin-antitoxin system HicA family toxin [Bacillus piscicola]